MAEMNMVARKREAHGRKGQFFLLGAFLVCILFFIGLPKQASVTMESGDDMAYFMENIQKEMPNAFNLGIARGDFLGTMQNFTMFSGRVIDGRRMSFGSLMFMGINSSASDFNVTVFNYVGSVQYVNVTIGSSMKQLLVANNASNSTTFSSPGQSFQISFQSIGGEKNLTWMRDKYSIYGTINLTRSDAVMIGEFSG